MKRLNVVALLIGLLLIGGLIGGNIAIVSAYNDGKTEVIQVMKTYQGRVFFTDEPEYDKFKNELATRDDLIIKDLQELSSAKPLVIFRITVDGTATFTYGTLVDEHIWYAWETSSLIVSLLLLNLLGGFMLFIYRLFTSPL